MSSFRTSTGAPMCPHGSIEVSKDFKFAPQDARLKNLPVKDNTKVGPPPPTKSIVLDAFKGCFIGNGFNTIFRPQGTGTFHTTFNTPVNLHGAPANDNVLELNLTEETLSFTRPDALADVPNRGLFSQSDIALVGVPYMQVVNDVTNLETGKADGTPSGIHFEPGLWMVVPAIGNDPKQPQSLNRMGSIPHGTTINAQGLEPASRTSGPPTIPPQDITPKVISTSSTPGNSVTFASQTASLSDTSRLPQDLTKFIATGAITQDILSDPNTVIRNHLKGQNVLDTTTFFITTLSTANLVGGGTANQAFLVGTGADVSTNNAPSANADAVQMHATFWVETVQWKLAVPVSKKGQQLHLTPPAPNPTVRLPSFQVTPPKDITQPVEITVTSTQIQYSQLVVLNFAGLSWPHCSVNTLAPLEPIVVDGSVFQ